ncbi:MAG: alpha/beta hydrolase [Synechococcales bacterium]|nr:alpha/beta hydrolase [Synechococcales bacterium]
MTYLAIRNFPHYYEWLTTAGTQRTGKPVLVFLHGWGGSARYWVGTAQSLQDQFDCLLYDLRGFGRSQIPQADKERTRGTAAAIKYPSENPYGLDTYATDLLELLNQLNLERVYLQAHSLGTSIAAFFLNQWGDRVERVVLTCAGVFEYDPLAFAAFYRFGSQVVKFRPRWLYGLPGMDRLVMQRFLHRPIAPSDRQAFLEDYLLAENDAALGTLVDAVSQRATEVLPQQFSGLTMPTLLISGACDRIIPAQLGRNAAALNEAIDYAIINHVGHFPMLEDQPTYLEIVRSFLLV